MGLWWDLGEGAICKSVQLIDTIVEMAQPKPSPKWLREVFFWSGIIATFCYRIIVIVNNYSKFWAQMAWYVGTLGFVIYFLHRYQISELRARLIKEHELDARVVEMDGLSEKERASMRYIFRTLKSTKEKWNYVFIFAMSAVAFAIGIYLDFLS